MNNTNTNTEASAVLVASNMSVEDFGKALKAFRANEAREKFEKMRAVIFSSNATHYFLREILNMCEQRDTADNINNLEAAVRLMKVKLQSENA
jgi:hypothetical protein